MDKSLAMTRRTLFRGIFATSAGLVLSSAPLINEVKVADVKIETEWVVDKCCYLHSISADDISGDTYLVLMYSDNLEPEKELFEGMLKTLNKSLYGYA